MFLGQLTPSITQISLGNSLTARPKIHAEIHPDIRARNKPDTQTQMPAIFTQYTQASYTIHTKFTQVACALDICFTQLSIVTEFLLLSE